MKIAKLLIVIGALFMFSCTNNSHEDRIPDLEDVDDILTPQLNVLNEAIEDDPNNPVYYFKRSKVYYDLRHYPLALNDINKAIKLDNTEGKFYLHLAQTNNHLGKATESLKAAHHAEELKVSDPELYILMADLYWELNDRVKSEQYVSKAEAIAPHHADVFVTRGKIVAAKGDTAGALKNLYTALSKDKNNIEAYKELVKVYHGKHKLDSTMVFIKKGLHINRTEPLFHFYEGKVYENLNLTNSSRIAYETAVSNDSSYYPASYELGLISYKANDLNAALTHFLNVTQYQTNMVSANMYVAELYEKANKEVYAIPYYERIVKADTSNHKAKASLEALYIKYPGRKAQPIKDTAIVIVPKDSIAEPVKKDSVKQELPKPKPIEKPKKVKKDTTNVPKVFGPVDVKPTEENPPADNPKVEAPVENNTNNAPVVTPQNDGNQESEDDKKKRKGKKKNK